MRHLISVIVPIYKIERYIGTCIESLLKQTYKNLEIILVNDGSPDRCPEICDLYASKDERIKVIHKDNGGLVSARKAGLQASTGHYVGYVDGDDWVEPDFYESLYLEILKTDADIVAAGQSRDLFEKKECFGNSIPVGVYEEESLDELRKNMLSNGDFYRPGITTYVWNKLFRREVLFEHQMNVDERITIGEDAAVTYPVIMSAKKLCVMDNCSYHYRQREDSMLKQNAHFEIDAEKLRYLYEYLTLFARKQSLKYNLQKQVNDFVLSICIMRSGLCGTGKYSFCDKEFYGKDIVIYSAGTFGQQLVNRLSESRRCNVVGWIDDDYWEYRRCCMDVDPVEQIQQMTYDYVFIASVDSIVSEKIEERLARYGVCQEKIISIQCAEENRQEMIQSFLY